MIATPSPYPLGGVNHTYYEGIAYGGLNRESLTIFTPDDATGPTPVVIDFHGGSFVSGDKESRIASNLNLIQELLENNIAFVSCDYRLNRTLMDHGGVRDCLKSATKAVQFIRLNSQTLNIDKEIVGIYGGSAGAGISMWLAYNPDQADPNSADPLFRESTLPKSISIDIPQATYDLVKWGSDVFERTEGFDVYDRYNNFVFSKVGIDRFYGIDDLDELFVNPYYIAYRNEVDMLRMIKENDIDPNLETKIWCDRPLDDQYGENGLLDDENHNPRHVEEIEKALTAKGLTSVIYCPALGFNATETTKEFFIRTLKQQ